MTKKSAKKESLKFTKPKSTKQQQKNTILKRAYSRAKMAIMSQFQEEKTSIKMINFQLSIN